MALRRGFKTEAEELAREVRSELDLGSVDPLNPWRLAQHLLIPVIPLSDYNVVEPSVVKQFGFVEKDAFSAVTIFDGSRRMIVHNDFHSERRQASNIAHELSHGLLLHPPSPPLSELGMRNWNQDIEDEANWLAGVLLIPEEAALYIVSRDLSDSQAGKIYGVSTDMVRFRVNVTGAIKRVRRRWRRR